MLRDGGHQPFADLTGLSDAGFQFIAQRQQLLHLGHDAVLFLEGGERDYKYLNAFNTNIGLCCLVFCGFCLFPTKRRYRKKILVFLIYKLVKHFDYTA